ncbi:MAG: hypothetical protein ABII18_09275 [bacterium]|nr:hypothetical protein [bacterium]
MFKKSIFLFLSLLMFCFYLPHSQAATSCDNTTTTCTDMCSNIYDTCSMSLLDSDGDAITEASCISACGSTDATVVSCLASVSCDADSIDSCLVTGTDEDDAATESDSSYIGGSGVSDGTTTTSGGACGEITDCNSCVTNCRCRYEGTVAANTCCTGCGCECELFCMPTEWWVATCL